MEYEYTGNCTLEEKVDIVSKEIVKAYSDIPLEVAKRIAILDDKITMEVNDHIRFKRLYNILLYTFTNNKIFSTVLKDLIYVYNSISDKTVREINLLEDIIAFYKGELEYFPIINDTMI